MPEQAGHHAIKLRAVAEPQIIDHATDMNRHLIGADHP
jgi:hypothetical protein